MLCITSSVFHQLLDEVEMVPEESCGFLFGKTENGDTKICEIMPVSNVSPDNKEVRFLIDGKDFMKAEKIADDNNLNLTGIYHTHLINSAYPSETDRASAFPNFSYLIIAIPNLKYSDMKFWKLNKSNQFEEEAFRILN